MEVQDFEMPSPKRQRSNPPNDDSAAVAAPVIQHEPGLDAPAQESESSTVNETNIVSKLPAPDDSDMLDVLMQHVESEAKGPVDPRVPIEAEAKVQVEGELNMYEEHDTSKKAPTETDHTPKIQHTNEYVLPEPGVSEPVESLPLGLEAAAPEVIDHLRAIADVNGLPPTSDTLAEAEIPPSTSGTVQTSNETEQQEWEIDSSPYDSSDSSDTSSDSSDDDSDDGDEYTLLDPYEQARILMAEDGGGGADSDEEGNPRPKNRSGGNPGLKTTNEQSEAILPKPNVTVTESMIIEELGSVEAIVENIVLVKAKTTGEYQVLEAGSILCLQDRSVIGSIAETLGRVQEPLYTVHFASPTDIQESGVSEKGTSVFYVKDHSTFVFTQPLTRAKGSDASNLHDEEVGDDEMEFSDDEAEAEHKRQAKLRRKGIDPSTMPAPNRGGRGGRGVGRGGRGTGARGGSTAPYMSSIPESESYANGSMEMNYDDVEEGETEYTPLRRPETLSNGGQTSPTSSSNNRGAGFSHNNQRGNRGNRTGRGDRQNNNNRGRGRGSDRFSHQHQNHNQYQNQQQPQQYAQYSPPSSTSMYSQPQSQYQPQQPVQSAFGFQMPQPPPPPHLRPSYSYQGQNSNMPPSPVTPLPSAEPHTGATPPFNFNFAAAANNGWQQYHQNQNSQYQQQMQDYGGGQQNTVNTDAIAQVQRQLEEMRKQSQYGNGRGR